MSAVIKRKRNITRRANNAPVNILPAQGGGGHTRGFRQKTIPDRREFDKLIKSGSRKIDFGRFLHPGTREFRRHKIKKKRTAKVEERPRYFYYK